MARNWQKHFPDHDVPGFIDFLVDEGALLDVTVKGGLPRFSTMEDESGHNIEVQHPLRSFRDTDDDFGRYLVFRGRRMVLDCDDLEEALLKVFSSIEKENGGPWEYVEGFAEEYSKKVGAR